MAAAAGLGPGATAGLAARLDWQPGLGAAEPWRAWSAAWVHYSPAHLGLNLLALALVAALGRHARRPVQAALAWAAAWPLTHVLMDVLATPAALAAHWSHYGGLSGVLHAGVMVIGIDLLRPAPACAATAPAGRRRERLVGAALVAGTLAKVLAEAPWDLALRPSAHLGIAVIPLAHATGALAGTACAAALAFVAFLYGHEPPPGTAR